MQRKYFGTDGIRGRVGESVISPEFVLKLGWAVGKVLGRQSQGSNIVLIGKDPRISGYMLESALEAGLSAAGMYSHLLGPMPTPAVAYLTSTLNASLGVMISASHNPYHDNGIKFFTADGRKLPDELELFIEETIEKPLTMVSPIRLGKAKRVYDAPGRYIEFCKGTMPSRMTLKGLKLVVDCANGATYHIAPNVFRELGAEVVEINVHPDGLNINERCGSMHPQGLQRMVQSAEADVGIAFDGDGDRLLMVDHEGHTLDGDDVLYMIAKQYQKLQILKGGVVGTVMSNFGLEQALQSLNIDFIRAKVGDRYVLDQLDERGWMLGGEPSGHVICLNKTMTGDGIISSLQVLSVMLQQQLPLAEVRKGIHKYPQAIENVPLKGKVSLDDPKIVEAMEAANKLLGTRGRFVLRPSGTEPVIRVMVEADDDNTSKKAMEILSSAVQSLTLL